MARDDHSETDAPPPRQSCGAAKGVNLTLGFVRVFRVVWIICCSALVVLSVISLALAAEPLLLWLAMFGISVAALPAGLVMGFFFLGCGVWMLVWPQPWWLVEEMDDKWRLDVSTALLLGRIGGGLFLLAGLVCLLAVFSRNRQPPDDRSRADKHAEQLNGLECQ